MAANGGGEEAIYVANEEELLDLAADGILDEVMGAPGIPGDSIAGVAANAFAPGVNGIGASPGTLVPAVVRPYVSNQKNAKKGGRKGGRKSGGSSSSSRNHKSSAANKGAKGAARSTAKTAEAEDGNDIDDHPYRVGSTVVARYVDETERLADIVHCASAENAANGTGDEAGAAAAAAASAAAGAAVAAAAAAAAAATSAAAAALSGRASADGTALNGVAGAALAGAEGAGGATAEEASAAAAAAAALAAARAAAGTKYRYYVHFHDVNRRMDMWIDTSRIVHPPSQGIVLAKAAKEQRERDRREAEARGRLEGADGDSSMRTRRQKRKVEGEGEEGGAAAAGPAAAALLGGEEDSHDEHEGLDEASLKEHEEVTKVKNINAIEFGRHRMECWYFSPFPKEYFPNGYADVLYFCEFSMRFFRHKSELLRYQRKHLQARHPPGNEIYRSGNLAMFEVDGAEQKEYCQNLCYMAKLFLDHKTLYYDVDPFLFYMMCEIDEYGFHPVGYFSKEKYSDVGYNLACILTFPCHQRKGYGRFLINFSYELSRKEEKVGSPEKPLSDLGAVSYRSFWSSVLLRELRSWPESQVSVMKLCLATSFKTEDVLATLNHLNLLKYVNGQYLIAAPPELIDELSKKYPIKEPVVDPSLLHWAPLLVGDGKRDKWSFRAKKLDGEAEGFG